MPRKFERAAVFLFLVASPFWLPVLPPRWGNSLRARWMDWMEPVLQTVEAVRQGMDGVSSAALGIFSLEEENRILRKRLEAFQVHEPIHQELIQENARLKRLLDFKGQSAWRTIPAEVIGREFGPWSRAILVDKGTRDGVTAGMAVITPVGLVGRVSEAGFSSSRVTLLIDPHFRISATLSQSRLAALCAGAGGGKCVATYLPLETPVAEGEWVVTAGGKSFAPRGIPIGIVRKVWKDSSEMFQTAGLSPAVELGSLEEVLILRWSFDSGS